MEEKRIQGNSEWLATYGIALKDEVACEVKGCVNEAEWYMMHRCCNLAFLGCVGHCHDVLRKLQSLAREGTMVTCGWCEQLIAPMDYMTRPSPLRLDADD